MYQIRLRGRSIFLRRLVRLGFETGAWVLPTPHTDPRALPSPMARKEEKEGTNTVGEEQQGLAGAERHPGSTHPRLTARSSTALCACHAGHSHRAPTGLACLRRPTHRLSRPGWGTDAHNQQMCSRRRPADQRSAPARATTRGASSTARVFVVTPPASQAHRHVRHERCTRRLCSAHLRSVGWADGRAMARALCHG